MDLFGFERNLVEHRLAGHAVVAFRMIGRHGALVYPVDVELVPRHALKKRLSWISQELEGDLWCRSSAAGDARAAALGGSLFCAATELLGGTAGQSGAGWFDDVFDCEFRCHSGKTSAGFRCSRVTLVAC